MVCDVYICVFLYACVCMTKAVKIQPSQYRLRFKPKFPDSMNLLLSNRHSCFLLYWSPFSGLTLSNKMCNHFCFCFVFITLGVFSRFGWGRKCTIRFPLQYMFHSVLFLCPDLPSRTIVNS